MCCGMFLLICYLTLFLQGYAHVVSATLTEFNRYSFNKCDVICHYGSVPYQFKVMLIVLSCNA